MNQSNHTPGPWHTQGCTIYAAGNRIAQTWDTCDDFPTPEMEADAHLIASAPDLLRALEWIVDDWEKITNRTLPDDHFTKVAISKAKGQP